MPESYTIPEAFRYESHTPSGVVEGEFKKGKTGELTDAEVAYLELHAVPFGLAVRGTATEPVSEPVAPAAPVTTEENTK